MRLRGKKSSLAQFSNSLSACVFHTIQNCYWIIAKFEP